MAIPTLVTGWQAPGIHRLSAGMTAYATTFSFLSGCWEWSSGPHALSDKHLVWFLVWFWDFVYLSQALAIYNCGWSGTCCVTQAGFELIVTPWLSFPSVEIFILFSVNVFLSRRGWPQTAASLRLFPSYVTVLEVVGPGRMEPVEEAN